MTDMPSHILDLDGSVGELPGARRIDLRHWHDALRFACSNARLQAFGDVLRSLLPAPSGPVFFGSGDFHHLSLPLIAAAAARQHAPVRVVVLDNHPDNMRFPFGVHCGSWVSRVAALPTVARVDVAGITSHDIAVAHAWENRLRPLYRRKLHYWSIGVDVRWARRAGLGQVFHDFDDADTMCAALAEDLAIDVAPAYLSIDKDVLHPDVAHSNWDQGCLHVPDVLGILAAMRPRVIGSDVNGEVSLARYPQRWKRLLSAIDHQAEPDQVQLSTWQLQQHLVNLALLQALA
jgi:arginase family enzyme